MWKIHKRESIFLRLNSLKSFEVQSFECDIYVPHKSKLLVIYQDSPMRLLFDFYFSVLKMSKIFVENYVESTLLKIDYQPSHPTENQALDCLIALLALPPEFNAYNFECWGWCFVNDLKPKSMKSLLPQAWWLNICRNMFTASYETQHKKLRRLMTVMIDNLLSLCELKYTILSGISYHQSFT